MTRADQERQKFRDNSGRPIRTRRLDESGGTWQAPQAVRKADPALEAAMRPFYADLTVKEREAVAAYYADTLPDQRTAARTLGIRQQTLHERLNGKPGHGIGALAKIRRALLEAAPPETRRALEEDSDGAFRDLRRWLTPAEHIREDGTEDPWMQADCLVCNRPLAKWRPNTITSGGDRYEEPRVLCIVHLGRT